MEHEETRRSHPVDAHAPADEAAPHDPQLWQRVFAQAGAVDPLTGAAFTQATLAGLAGGVGFMFATFRYADVTTATVVLRAHPEPYVEDLVARSGVEVRSATTTSARVAAARLLEELAGGSVAVVRVSPTVLSGRGATTPLDEESVDVAVSARDGDRYLLDMGAFGGKRTVDAESLAAARSAKRGDRHAARFVSAHPSQSSAADLDASLRAALRCGAERMLGRIPLNGIPASWISKFGVAGMRTWATLLTDERSPRGWPALFADPDRFSVGLRILRATALSPVWGGVDARRGLHAETLREAATIPGLSGLAGIATTYDRLAREWADLLALLDDPDDVGDRAAHFATLAGRLVNIADREEEAAERTLRVVRE